MNSSIFISPTKISFVRFQAIFHISFEKNIYKFLFLKKQDFKVYNENN